MYSAEIKFLENNTCEVTLPPNIFKKIPEISIKYKILDDGIIVNDKKIPSPKYLTRIIVVLDIFIKMAQRDIINLNEDGKEVRNLRKKIVSSFNIPLTSEEKKLELDTLKELLRIINGKKEDYTVYPDIQHGFDLLQDLIRCGGIR